MCVGAVICTRPCASSQLFFFSFFCEAANWIIRGALYTAISRARAAGGGIARPYPRKARALKKKKKKKTWWSPANGGKRPAARGEVREPYITAPQLFE